MCGCSVGQVKTDRARIPIVSGSVGQVHALSLGLYMNARWVVQCVLFENNNRSLASESFPAAVLWKDILG